MKTKSLLQKVKDWWPLYGILGAVCSLVLLWGNLPKRVEKVEAGQTKQAEDIVDLKGIAKKLEGYTEAMNRQQQQPQQPAPTQAPPPTHRPGDLREYEDGVGFWCCNASEEWRDWCYEYAQWFRCD